MAVTITSTHDTAEELQESMKSMGIAISGSGDSEVEGTTTDKSTEETPGGGDKHPEKVPESGDEKKPETEEETSTQEGEKPDTEEEEPEVKEPPKGSKGGLESKLKLLTKQRNAAQERLTESDGKNKQLEAEVARLTAEMSKLKPAEEKPEEKPLIRPTRPKRADFSFDDDAYEAAMDKYDTELEAYNTQVRKNEVAATVKTIEESQKQKEAEAKERELQTAFAGRLEEDIKGLEDYQELIEALPDDGSALLDQSDVARNYLRLTSEHPGLLMRYLMNDLVNEGNAENERLIGMDPYRLVRELTRIEDKLVAESAAKKAPAKEATTEETKPPAEPEKKPAPETKAAPPAKQEPKPKKAPEPPLETVGARTSTTGPIDWNKRLEEAAKNGNYLAVRKEMLAHQAAQRRRA